MEEWKDIEWYEWYYQASNLWKVRSIKFWREIILSPSKVKVYSRITLYTKWIPKYFSVHRVVAKTFIQNPENLTCVCHKDETLDENWFVYNWVDNLFWWSYTDNNIDTSNKWRHWIKWKFWKENHSSKKLYQYTLDWWFIKEWWSTREVQRELWISHWNISSCCTWRRKNKIASWYIWSYEQLPLSIIN